MDYSQMPVAPVEGERIHESLGKIWAIVGGCLLVGLFGGLLVWAWWTEFVLYETEEVRAIRPRTSYERGRHA
jgi:hypothetical protein